VIAPDVNVLIYAVREDVPLHAEYKNWLERARRGAEPLAFFEPVLASTLRILTNPRVYPVPMPLSLATDFLQQMLDTPHAVRLRPGERHWETFVRLCQSTNCRGDLVQDAYLAALAIEHNCDWITADLDFARFPGLHWRHPLDSN